MAVAVLPSLAGIGGTSYLHPAVFSTGFHRAVLIAAGACAIGSVLALVTIRNDAGEPTGATGPARVAVRA